MESSGADIQTGDGRTLTRAEFLQLINTYNCFLQETSQLRLSYQQDANGGVLVEGFLSVSWGVHRPIRLKIQDEPRAHDPTRPISKSGMTRWGEYIDLHQIGEADESTQEVMEDDKRAGPQVYQSSTLCPGGAELPEGAESQLIRCMSDASLVKRRRRGRGQKTGAELRHRFSINGHFYNYKTSIFTPSFGTSTRVRVSTMMTADEVIKELLNKFKMENDPQEFALYCVHQSGERRKLAWSQRPLWERLLQGPSEDIMKLFLMDQHQQEVSTDVARYLNLDFPILEQVLLELAEEENRAVQVVVSRFQQEYQLMSHVLNLKTWSGVETPV